MVLGTGKRLFTDVAAPTAMALAGTRTTGNGVVVLTYRPAGPAEFGAIPEPG